VLLQRVDESLHVDPVPHDDTHAHIGAREIGFLENRLPLAEGGDWLAMSERFVDEVNRNGRMRRAPRPMPLPARSRHRRLPKRRSARRG
jgi:hypothetical protein